MDPYISDSVLMIVLDKRRYAYDSQRDGEVAQ